MPKALSQNRLHIGLGIEHVRRTRNQAQEVRDYPEIALITPQGCLRLSRDGFFRRNSNASHKFSLFLCQCSDVLHLPVPNNRYNCKLYFASLASTTFPCLTGSFFSILRWPLAKARGFYFSEQLIVT